MRPRTLPPPGLPALLLPVLLCVVAPAAADQTIPSDPMVEPILSRLKLDIERLRELTWVETAVLEKRDRDGSVQSRTVEAEEIFFDGNRRMKRPLSVDLSGDSESLSVVRREESQFLQQGPAREVKKNPFDLDNLVRCFRFTSDGREESAGGPRLRLRFRPVDGCLDDSSRAGRILNNLTGSIWIDEATSEILRLEGVLEKPVSFGFGILGRVDSFQIRLDREAVSPGVWAIVRSDYRARGRSFIFNRFDVRSTRYRSAFARNESPPAAAAPGRTGAAPPVPGEAQPAGR